MAGAAASVTFYDVEIVQSSAIRGAAMYVGPSGIARFFGRALLQRNNATGSGGCLFLAEGARAAFEGTNFTLAGNRAAVNGGAIAATSGSAITIAGNVVLAANTAGTPSASASGGALLLNFATMNFSFGSRVDILDNVCHGTGGGLALYSSTLQTEGELNFVGVRRRSQRTPTPICLQR